MATMMTPALYRIARLITLLVVTSVDLGCLVVADPEFRGEEDCPPILLVQKAFPPVTRFQHVDASRVEELRHTVPMRSCAVKQPFFAYVCVDGELLSENPIYVPTTGTEYRNVSFQLSSNLSGPWLDAGCHRFELYVSSSQQSNQCPPSATEDWTAAVWWYVVDGDASTPRVSSCPGYQP